MGTSFSLLIIPVRVDYKPDNNELRRLIEYIEENDIIKKKSEAKYPGYAIDLRLSPHPKPRFERIEFTNWEECKKNMLFYLENGKNIENISFIIEISDNYRNIFLKYKRYLTSELFGNFYFGIENPPKEIWEGDKYKKGETYFSIETYFFPGPLDLTAERKLLNALRKDQDFKKILKDFEDILDTKLKIDSEWSW